MPNTITFSNTPTEQAVLREIVYYTSLLIKLKWYQLIEKAHAKRRLKYFIEELKELTNK